MIRRALLALLIFIVAAVAFLVLDFRAAKSTTNAESVFTSAKNGTAPGAAVPVYLWIEEKDSLSTGLRDELLSALRATGRFDVQVLPTAKPASGDAPLLRVWVERPGLSWTPFYAQADMLVRYGFSTYTTEIDFEEDAPVQLPAGEYAFYGEGRLTLKDRSFGLISLRGYWQYLAAQAAEKITADLQREMP